MSGKNRLKYNANVTPLSITYRQLFKQKETFSFLIIFTSDRKVKKKYHSSLVSRKSYYLLFEHKFIS